MAAASAPNPEALDGRRLRSERSRTAVVDALLELHREGQLRPGASQIASRAGVSERSVFRHFEDLDTLVEEAIVRQWARVGPAFAPPDPTGTTDQRIAALAEQRLAIHDAVAPTARAAMLLAPDSYRLTETLARRRQLLDDQVAVHFATDLATRGPRDRAELTRALAAVASFEHVEHLRAGAGLDAAATRRIVVRTLTALLAS